MEIQADKNIEKMLVSVFWKHLQGNKSIGRRFRHWGTHTPDNVR